MSDIETLARRLIRRHSLVSISFTIGLHSVTASARPSVGSPIANFRRERMQRALVARGITEISLTKAREITDRSLEKIIGLACAAMPEALGALDFALREEMKGETE